MMILVQLLSAAALMAQPTPGADEERAARIADAMRQAEAKAATRPPQTCVSRPANIAAAEAALVSKKPDRLAPHFVHYRAARAAGLPDCQGE